MEFYYVNHRGVRIDLSKYPFMMQNSDLIDYEWQYTVFEGVNKNRVQKTYKSAETKSIKIAAMPNFNLKGDERIREFKSNVQFLLETLDTDVVENRLGRLYTSSGEYIQCMIIKSVKSNWDMHKTFMFNSFSLLVPNPVWVTEKNKSFKAGDSPRGGEWLDYDFDYNYEYSIGKRGNDIIEIDAYSKSDFHITIYGPCANPKVVLGSRTYQVYSVLEEREYITINSQDNTVYKHLKNGLKENIYDLRLKRSSIFEKIPFGIVSVNWSGDFGFDLKVYVERSQPVWNL